jgi:hypothetical protein
MGVDHADLNLKVPLPHCMVRTVENIDIFFSDFCDLEKRFYGMSRAPVAIKIEPEESKKFRQSTFPAVLGIHPRSDSLFTEPGGPMNGPLHVKKNRISERQSIADECVDAKKYRQSLFPDALAIDPSP